jgi:prolyl 4-hydroxylase
MLLSLALLLSLARANAAPKDSDPNCGHWADIGECESNAPFMLKSCAAACASQQTDALSRAECDAVAAETAPGAGCRSRAGVEGCRVTCFRAQQAALTEDTLGNCWYWGTDGECEANPAWMQKSCARSCTKLRACSTAQGSAACAQPFECPLEKDSSDDCVDRALRGECRSESAWVSAPLLRRCQHACTALDPTSASHTVTRPMVKRSARIDADMPRHAPDRCDLGPPERVPLLGHACPNTAPLAVPWARASRRCPAAARALRMTPRVANAALPAPVPLPELARGPHPPPESARPGRVELISANPRVRLVHDFVSPQEARALIALAEPLYHRSGTARAGSDDKRTSFSASLSPSDAVVRAVRHRISHFSGYPEANLEPLQTVRYHTGQYYKPHHDFYNACETWANGNRHFTFLIYLNRVEEGGETTFPKLNITVSPTAYAALVFNNCLDNGEPDERSLHEGVPPSKGTKYAINGWMRAKRLGSIGL